MLMRGKRLDSPLPRISYDQSLVRSKIGVIKKREKQSFDRTWWTRDEVAASILVILDLVRLVVYVHGETMNTLVTIYHFVTSRILIR